jgi:aerobic carbon-monoxide dehydrogenase medium subunit
VIPAAFDHAAPATLDEAIELLRAGDARALAGGHALIPDLKHRRARPGLLVDLAGIPDLHGIDVAPDGLVTIGAMTTSAEIEHDRGLAATVPLLTGAAPVISDPLIRNRATLGGSLAEADPRSDWPPVLLAAGATVHLRGPDGTRALAVEEFLTPRPGARTALRPAEVLVAVTLDADPEPGTYLKRHDPASGYAQLGVATAVHVDGDGVCRRARVAITGATAAPVRLAAVEDRLIGEPFTRETITAASRLVDGVAVVAHGLAPAEYLRAILPVQVERALHRLRSG